MPVSLTSIGISGVLAAEAGFATVESNISNASNPNYSVESVNLAARPGINGGSAGVDVLGVERAQAPFLSTEIANTQSTVSFNSSFAQALQQAEAIVAPGSGGDLGSSIQNLFNAFSSLAASPQDPTLRAAVLNAASNFAGLAQSTYSSLGQVAGDTGSQLTSLVQQVNDDTQQIAALNEQINTAQGNTGGGAALQDQRDALVSQLSNLIGATADSNGNVSVGGLPLVSGTTPLTLSTTGSGSSTALLVTLAKGTLQIGANQVGGTIGGVLSSVSSVLQLQSGLNNFATAVASAINTQHQAGFGLDGSTGNALFLVPSGGGPISLNPAINAQKLAAASSAGGVPGDGSNASAIAALASAVGADSTFPTAILAQAFGQIASGFGATLQAAQNDQTQATSSLSALTQLKGSMTGVSLNDQLTQLIQYQNTLQAAGKALQASDNILTFLIQEL